MTTPSREEIRRQRRQRMDQRLQQAQQGAQRQRLMSRLRAGALIGLLVLVVGLGVFWVFREATAPLPGQPVADEGRTHVDTGSPLSFATYPPASGAHYENTARWDFYDSEVSPGFWVHNLEHGGVVLLYKCPSSCAELKSQLKGLTSSLRRSKYGYVKLVVAPDNNIQGQVVALAWDRREVLESFDANTLQRFYEAYVDHGPEDAP